MMSAAAKRKPLSPGRIRLHRLVWRLGRPIAHLAMHRRYRFKGEPIPDLPECFLVYANHVTLMDPFLISDSFPRQMYYVASEHIQRRSIAPLMMKLVDPIVRRKSRTETTAAMDILRRLRAGCSVCVFIEGERSYGGQTEFIPDSAAHLAKMCACSLVTYRFENGYLTEPRWAVNTRPNGHMSGHAVRIYSPQELQSMSREQVLQHIREDLWLDAYEQQQLNPLPYPGKNLAEDLETVLFYCPCCGAVGRMKSGGDRFRCLDCDLDLRYTEYAQFEAAGDFAAAGKSAPFANVRDWYLWQQEATVEYVRARVGQEEPLTADDEQLLYAVNEEEHTSVLRATGRLALYGDRLEFRGQNGFDLVLPLEKLQACSCHERTLLSFAVKRDSEYFDPTQADFYEVNCVTPRSHIKYQLMFKALKALAAPESGAEAKTKTQN